MTYTAWRTDTTPIKCLYQTEQGRVWKNPDDVKEVNASIQPVVLTIEEAQQLSNQTGLEIAVHEVSDDFVNQLTEMKNTPQTEQPQAKEPARKVIFKGRRPRKEQQPEQQKEQQPEQQKEQQPQGKRKLSLLMLFLCFCLGIALVLVAAWNIQPFIKFVEMLSSKIQFDRFVQLLSFIPFIGGIVMAISTTAIAIIGTVIYVICQAGELGPMLYKRDPDRMRQTLNSWASWAKYLVNQGDSRRLRELKRSYNNHPIQTYQFLCNLRDCIYIFELFVCLITEPPSQPFWMFPWYLITLQWGRIDWINVALALSILFLVQLIVAGFLRLWPEVYPIVQDAQQQKGEVRHAQ